MIDPAGWLASVFSGTTLVIGGVAYGDMRARLRRIEKALFNGEYVTKKEMEVEVQQEKIQRLEGELEE